MANEASDLSKVAILSGNNNNITLAIGFAVTTLLGVAFSRFHTENIYHI